MRTTTDPSAVVPGALLQVDAVSVRFGGLLALDSVSFAIERGSVFGLIGPNGAGKSTLFNAVTGVRPPTSGHVVYNGRSIEGQPPWRIARRGIARTFQNIRLFSSLSVLDNVLIARHIRSTSLLVPSILRFPSSVREERASRAHALELLDLVGLVPRAHATSSSLPYADQRRLEIARALALEPELLLLDEPAAGMNTSEKASFVDFVHSLRERFDLTICIIEHHVPLVMGVCDRIVVLNFGRVIADGAPPAVRADPAVIDAYLGEAG
jgi:branched-chain amino acid transport system ATP-binding protein